jgi:hypothetical protein
MNDELGMIWKEAMWSHRGAIERTEENKENLVSRPGLEPNTSQIKV